MRPAGIRDPVAGPDTGPESPFPLRLSGPVIKGFGRGSKELGIPTANIPPEGLDAYPDLQTGVYYGVVALDPARFLYDVEAVTARTSDGSSGATGADASSPTILPAVLSIGYNPFYKNTVRSVEIHIMPPLSAPSPTAAATAAEERSSQEQEGQQTAPGRVKFHKLPDFYGTKLNLLILGYIRPEYDYVSLEALIEDIRVDCEVARQSLAREAYACYLSGNGSQGQVQVDECRKWLMSF